MHKLYKIVYICRNSAKYAKFTNMLKQYGYILKQIFENMKIQKKCENMQKCQENKNKIIRHTKILQAKQLYIQKMTKYVTSYQKMLKYAKMCSETYSP